MYKEEYEKWLNSKNLHQSLREELENLSNIEIEKRFNSYLSFGTAGARGVLGVGSNRMNYHTVAWITNGILQHLQTLKKKTKVVIGCDVRHYSIEFASLVASILSKNDVEVYMLGRVPVSLISYSTREMKADIGIMITASHNPKEYNGYKIYGSNGAQIVGEVMDNILFAMEALKNNIVDIEIPLIYDSNIKLIPVDIISNYKKEVLNISYQSNDKLDKSLSIVFSPLNGTGLMIEEILKKKGYMNLYTVNKERNPDPNFTTTYTPNPENPEVFKLAKATGFTKKADILLATDPDADRVGIMVFDKNKEEYVYITGNQLGLLLSNYIMNSKLPPYPVIVKTIVTGKLVNKLAEDKDVEIVDTLVGFKNIYELVEKWENNENNYILGYEESLGYGIAKFVRDKDAILTSSIIVEMAAFYKNENKDLLEVLEDIYKQYGYEHEELLSVKVETHNLSKDLISDLRENPPNVIEDLKLLNFIDYEFHNTGLPKTNAVLCEYENAWFAIRPSGTEPKLKFYIYGYGKTKKEAIENTNKIIQYMNLYIKTI